MITPPPIRKRHIVMSVHVCLFACLSTRISQELQVRFHHNYYHARYLLPWLEPQAYSGGIVYFRFWRWRHVCTQIMSNNRRPKLTQQQAARISHCGIYSDWPTRGITGRGRSLISTIALLTTLQASSVAYCTPSWNALEAVSDSTSPWRPWNVRIYAS